jgi:hypothetical protein
VGEESRELVRVLAHAERLAGLLFVHELTPPHGDEAAARWLLGRAAEVERYVETVVDDQAAGLLDAHAAVTTLQQYIDEIHAGLVGVTGAAPSCCHPTLRRRRRRR